MARQIEQRERETMEGEIKAGLVLNLDMNTTSS